MNHQILIQRTNIFRLSGRFKINFDGVWCVLCGKSNSWELLRKMTTSSHVAPAYLPISLKFQPHYHMDLLHTD
jgi:hypothetical protein